MIRQELRELVSRLPFEPFRIKLVNGDFHDVLQPLSLALLSRGIYVTSQDGHWVIFATN